MLTKRAIACLLNYMTTQPAEIIILPLDVDDPEGYSVNDALDRCSIDRITWPSLGDVIEDEWWRCYGDAAEQALSAAGYRVVRLKTGLNAHEMAEMQAEYDDVFEGGDLPVDMVAVDQAAKVRFDAWWKANADALITKHRPDWALYDADTGEMIGKPTGEQIDASLADAAGGRILIDADGEVIVDAGSWAAQQPGVRRVYVA